MTLSPVQDCINVRSNTTRHEEEEEEEEDDDDDIGVESYRGGRQLELCVLVVHAQPTSSTQQQWPIQDFT